MSDERAGGSQEAPAPVVPCHEMLAAPSSPRCSLPHVIIALLGKLLSLEGGFEGGLGSFVGLDRTLLRRSREYSSFSVPFKSGGTTAA